MRPMACWAALALSASLLLASEATDARSTKRAPALAPPPPIAYRPLIDCDGAYSNARVSHEKGTRGVELHVFGLRLYRMRIHDGGYENVAIRPVSETLREVRAQIDYSKSGERWMPIHLICEEGGLRLESKQLGSQWVPKREWLPDDEAEARTPLMPRNR